MSVLFDAYLLVLFFLFWLIDMLIILIVGADWVFELFSTLPFCNVL